MSEHALRDMSRMANESRELLARASVSTRTSG
jgi:hypothetical protein